MRWQSILGNKKLKGAAGVLYKAMNEFFENKKEESEPISEKEEKRNNKFITEIKVEDDEKESKLQYYAFGTQFKYTENLKEHPLYVKAKYKDLNQELFAYLMRVNTKSDGAKWNEKKLEIIQTMDAKLQPILKQFLNNEPIKNENVLWLGDDDENKDGDSGAFSAFYDSYDKLDTIMQKLCPTTLFETMDEIVLVPLLENKFQNIKAKHDEFISRRVSNEDIKRAPTRTSISRCIRHPPLETF